MTSKAGKWQYAKTEKTPGRQCKDCLANGDRGYARVRPAPHPGPRCTTHHREVLRARRLARSVRHVENTYGLTDAEYNALYEFQGGRCALCRRATGASKRLAVDHDHACCPGPKSCGRCPRMLLCSPCNDILAHLRDDPAAFERGADLLRNWPSRRAGVVPPKNGV